MCGEFDTTGKFAGLYETAGNEVSAIVVDRWLEECIEHFKTLPAEERAYKVIHTYLQMEDPADAMYDRFVGWFLDGRNRAAKERAMERMFVEVLDRGREWETRKIEIQI